MKRKNLLYLLLWSIVFIAMTSCGDKEDLPIVDPEPGTIPEKTYSDGFTFYPDTITADQPLTITFKAPEGTSLYGISDNLYLYSGLGGAWQGAPSSWTDNQDKYKMEPVNGSANTWSVTLPGSVRSFYSKSTSSNGELLNIIIRTSDGSEQTYDCTFPVITDDFTFTTTQEQAVPVGSEASAGIHINSTSSVTLVLYDRASDGSHKSHAYVIGSFNDWQLNNRYQMKYDPSKYCWWITLENLPAEGFTFQYYVYNRTDGGSVLCDPYSEMVREKGVDSDYPIGAYGRYVSYVQTNTMDYTWNMNDFKVKDPQSLVIYEMLLRDFTDMHNLEGARQKIDYLKSLGVNAIELMPVQEFEGDNSWGYNTSLYYALDNSYGTKNEYKTFIDECHKAGIAVILDVVYNHTNDNNPFSKLYWDIYNNRPSTKNPWLNTQTPHKKYVFSSDDFNHQSEVTRDFVKRNLHYLIDEYNIDGFRFDFTKGFTQRNTTGDSDLSAYDADRVAVLKEYYESVKAAKDDAIVIMEHFCDAEEQTLAGAGISFWRNMNYAFAQSAMGWSDDSDFKRLYEENHPAQFVGYMESHDEERMGYKQSQWGNGVLKSDLKSRMNQLAVNAAFFLMTPGPKMIWQFGELGYDYSINSNQAGTSVSEDYRTSPKPIRWDYNNQEERKSLKEVYTRLLSIRNEYPQLFNDMAMVQRKVSLSDWNNGRSIYLKAISGEELVVLGNFTNQEIKIQFPATIGTWENMLTNQIEELASTLTLSANDVKVYLKK